MRRHAEGANIGCQTSTTDRYSETAKERAQRIKRKGARPIVYRHCEVHPSNPPANLPLGTQHIVQNVARRPQLAPTETIHLNTEGLFEQNHFAAFISTATHSVG